MMHIKSKVISRPLFSIFHFKIEPPSKENELKDLTNILKENQF